MTEESAARELVSGSVRANESKESSLVSLSVPEVRAACGGSSVGNPGQLSFGRNPSS